MMGRVVGLMPFPAGIEGAAEERVASTDTIHNEVCILECLRI